MKDSDKELDEIFNKVLADGDEINRLASLIGTDARNPEFQLWQYLNEQLYEAKQRLNALIEKKVREARIAVVQSQIDFNYSYEENIIRLKKLQDNQAKEL